MLLQELFDGLNSGKRYILRQELELERALYDRGEHRYFCPSPNLYMTNGYIGWRHFGSSANTNSIDDLEWIVKTIFEDKNINDFVDFEEATKDKRYKF